MGKEIRELAINLSDSRLYNRDIAPTSLAERTWGMWDIAALWVGMSVCIPTYMLASSLIQGGMNWWEAISTIFLGNTIVLIPMILVAHAGTRYGIPFPVLTRASFGLFGANIPSLLRAIVACGWFGIQTWIGGAAIHQLMSAGFTWWNELPIVNLGFVGNMSLGAWLGFGIFWFTNMAIIWKGIDSIRFLEKLGSPFLLLIGLGLLAWAYCRAGGLGPMLSKPDSFENLSEFFSFFFPALTGMVGYWATLALNIPDFSRYAKTQRDQILGQALGLNTTMPLFAFIGVAVTSATLVIFGEEIWDPVQLLGRFSSVPIVILSMLALAIATLTTNLAANVVAPANAFTNIAPTRISFRTGGIITGIIGILMMPWKLLSDPTGYIFTWLIGYSALLGPIAGILISDYYVRHRMELNLEDLYRDGEYTYSRGFNWLAIAALILSIVPNIPGFLGTIQVTQVGPFWMKLYTYAWFVGFLLSFCIYTALYLRYNHAHGK
ncbi:MAG: NCS1 family nucleobase:cation symporter-1 [Pseudomonadota bacterium]